MNKGESLRSAAKWLLFGKIGNRFTEFAFGIILARLLTPADFGMIATVTVFTGFVGMFASGGMGQSLIRSKIANENDFTAVFTLQLSIGVLIYFLFFCTAPWIAQFLENSLYADLIRINALTFLMRPFSTIRSSWLSREMRFKNQSIIDASLGLISGTLSSAMAWYGLGVWSLALTGLVCGLLKNAWLSYITPIKIRINMDISTMRKHSSYGSMIILNDFVLYLRKEGKNLLITKLAGPTFLGIFNKAESLSRLPNDLLMPSTIQPVFREMSKAQDNLDKVKYLLYRVISIVMIYTGPFYIVLIWIAKPFVTLIYGEKWLEVAEPMSILALSGFFLNIIYPCGAVLATQNRLKSELFTQLANFPIFIISCIIGLNWGGVGVAIGLLFSQFLLAFNFYCLVYRILPTRIHDLFKAITPGLSLSFLMFIELLFIDFLFKLLVNHEIFFKQFFIMLNNFDLIEIPNQVMVFFSDISILFITAPDDLVTYFIIMSLSSVIGYVTNFMLLQNSIVKSEASRLKQQVSKYLK